MCWGPCGLRTSSLISIKYKSYVQSLRMCWGPCGLRTSSLISIKYKSYVQSLRMCWGPCGLRTSSLISIKYKSYVQSLRMCWGPCGLRTSSLISIKFPLRGSHYGVSDGKVKYVLLGVGSKLELWEFFSAELAFLTSLHLMSDSPPPPPQVFLVPRP